MPLNHAEREALQEMRDRLDALLSAKGCSSCLNFNGRKGECEFWGAIVPVEAREAGCDNFVGEVPF